MDKQDGLVALFLSILLLPGTIGATPLVSMKSNKVVLTAEASGTMISGGEWRLTRHLQTDFFDKRHVSIYGEQVNLDVDGNFVIDPDVDEAIDLCIIASYEQSGTSFGSSTHATLYDEGTLSGTNAGPLADLRDGSINIQAKVWVKSIFKVTSVVSYINRAFRKPLKPRVQGTARREWLFPFQGLQRRNRGLSGFPQGEVGHLNANSG